MEDHEIVSLLYGRSEQGLEEIGKKYGDLLLFLSRNILKDHMTAEECVNDTYLKIWNIIPPYRPTHLKSFLCKITRQIAIDKYRREHSKKQSGIEIVSLSDMDEDEAMRFTTEVCEVDLQDEINTFLLHLNVTDRTLFIRRYFMFESPSSLASRFEMSENAVAVKLFRIREKLKKYLKERGYRIDDERKK